MLSRKYRSLVLFAWLMQALIVLSGAAVRLTEAGLGCEDWPTCNQGELLPAWQFHGLIEFGNRVISLLVTASAIAALIATYRRTSRRPDLIRYSWALVIGTAVQVVLGGITVLLDLHPIVVSVHFLVSMALLWAAESLWLLVAEPHVIFDSRESGSREADVEPATAESPGSTLLQNLVKLQLGLATMVLLAGTVVSGTGPHSGDSRADRLGFDLEAVARIHSALVWLLVASLVGLVVLFRRLPATASFTIVRWLILTVMGQGALGYLQFSLGVPAGLVELHIFGAIVVWSLSIALFRSVIGFGGPDGRRHVGTAMEAARIAV